MDDRPPSSANAKPSRKGEPAEQGRVVEWFRADGAPFGDDGPSPNGRRDLADQSREEAVDHVSAALRRARSAVAAVEKALAESRDGKPAQIKTEIERVALSLLELEGEREAVEIALGTLKRRQRKRVC